MFLYIDPGTGSMLFTILIGLFGALFYSIKIFFMKLRSWFGGGKVDKDLQKVPFVIYSDDKRYWSIFAPICKELEKLGKDVLYLTGSEDDPVFEQGFKHIKAECIGRKNSSFFRLNYINATILLSTTPGLGVYQWKRSKKVDCYVHIPHAAGDITMYRMFGIDCYDTILLSGQFQVQDVRKLEKLRNLPAKELVKVGIPYMDEMAKRLQNAEPIGEHERTILLAPSWGPSAIFSVFGGKIIEELLKTGYKIIVRPHPQSFMAEKELMDELMTKFPASEKLKWNRDNDNFEVLRKSDILISDFSGVIFDFSLVYGKPVIYTDPNFDLGPYDAWWLEDEIWTKSALRRIGKQLDNTNIKDIKNLIDDCLENKDMVASLQEVKNETWEHFGEGTRRTVDFLLKKYDDIVLEKSKKKETDNFGKKKKKRNNSQTEQKFEEMVEICEDIINVETQDAEKNIIPAEAKDSHEKEEPEQLVMAEILDAYGPEEKQKKKRKGGKQ